MIWVAQFEISRFEIMKTCRTSRWGYLGSIIIIVNSIITIVISNNSVISISGKDKGGPSKGGFLNNRLFSWNDILFIYICH